MLTSMTGLGRGTAGTDGEAVQVIVRAYNARFLEMKIRGLSASPEIEVLVRNKITNTIVRGSVLISVEKVQETGKGDLSFNRQRFEAIENVLYNIQKEYGRTLDMSSFLSSEDLFSNGNETELHKKNVMKALQKALNQVSSMRSREGNAIHNDTLERIKKLYVLVENIDELSENISNEQTEKIRQRLDELMDNSKVDDSRLSQEIAILADRLDISEELVRIRSHIDQYTHLIELDEPVGKRLSFLLQEMGREINTVGSKCGTGDIINIVVDFKNQLEKIREQAQNVL